MYSNFQDLYEKIDYFLEHEEERTAIARAGYLKVRKHFTYAEGIKAITAVMEELDE